MRIIIVDDEMKALNTFLEDIMSEEQMEYHFFKDDEDEILKYIDKRRVDAAFLDINMPSIYGIDLARILISHCPDIKIAFITGSTKDESNLPEIVKDHCIGFIYKPYDKESLSHYLEVVKAQTNILKVVMFDTFDCFLNDRIVKFSSNKSMELFALLLVYKGKNLSMSDAITQLWPDYDLDKAKILYRDAVWRLRKTLKDIGFNCVLFFRGSLGLRKENIQCDFWDYLEGKNNDFHGEFLKSFDWSIEYLGMLEDISDKRN